MNGKEYKDKKGKVWIKYSNDYDEKNLEKKVVKVEEWLKNNLHLKSDSGASTNVDSNKNSGTGTDDLNEKNDKRIEFPKLYPRIDPKNNKNLLFNHHHPQHDKPLIDQLKESREKVFGIINKIDNYLKYDINSKSGARDLKPNKQFDEAIDSQKSNNVFTEVWNKGRFKGIPLVGAILRPGEESKNQSYQKNECGKKKLDKAIFITDLMQGKCESNCNIKKGGKIPVIESSFKSKPKNQLHQPRMQKVLDNLILKS